MDMEIKIFQYLNKNLSESSEKYIESKIPKSIESRLEEAFLNLNFDGDVSSNSLWKNYSKYNVAVRRKGKSLEVFDYENYHDDKEKLKSISGSDMSKWIKENDAETEAFENLDWDDWDYGVAQDWIALLENDFKNVKLDLYQFNLHFNGENEEEEHNWDDDQLDDEQDEDPEFDAEMDELEEGN